MNSCYPRRTVALIQFLVLSLILLAPVAHGRPAAGAKIDLETLPVRDPAAGGDRDLGTSFFAAAGAGAFGQPGTNATGYDFEGVEPAGWHAVAPGGETHWHLEDVGLLAGHAVDMSGALPFDTGDTENSFALWCGTNTDPDFLSDGYGNNWDEAVVVHFDLSVTTDVSIDFYMNCDFEGDSYDYFQVEVSGADGTWTEIYVNDTSAEQILNHIVVTVDSADIDGWLEAVRFRFRSDSSWSDEDGSFISDIGAVWIDNLIIDIDGSTVLTADFEDEVVPENIHMMATSDFDTENYTVLHDGVEIGDSCWDDTHSAWGFFDPETTEPAYPDGVISYGPPWAYMVLQSPTFEVDQDGTPISYAYGEADTLFLNYEAYIDLPLSPLILLRYWVSARVEGSESFGSWQTDNTLYYGWSGGECFTTGSFNIESMALDSSGPGTMTGLKVRIELVDMCPDWCGINGDGLSHTVGMLIDGVSVGISGTPSDPLLPVAVFDATPNPVELSQTVSFDGSGSYHEDSGANLVNFEWDFDGDGIYDESGSMYIDHIYPDIGTYTARLRVTDDAVPAAMDSMDLDIVVEPLTTSVPEIPNQFRLYPNVPNPFNPSTKLRFDLTSAGDVDLSIFDISGRKIRNLVREYRAAGTHEVSWNGRNNSGVPVPSGVYFVRLLSGTFVGEQRLILLK